MKKIVALLFLSTLVTLGFGQKKKANYGANAEDSVKCVRNYSLYIEFHKQKNYADAFEPWKQTIQYCPKLSKSLYLNGAKMYKSFIKAEKDSVKREELIDAQMDLYDLRIKNFGQEAFVLGKKGTDHLKYRKSQPKVAFEMLNTSFEKGGEKTAASVLVSLYKAVYLMYREKAATKEDLLNWYPKISDVLSAKMKAEEDEKKKDNLKSAQGNIDKVFTAIAGCEDLISFYGPKVEAEPENIELLKNVTRFLEKQKCTEDPLYFKAASALCAIESSFSCKYALGKNQKDNCSKAIVFFKDAYELAEDDQQKAKSLQKITKCYLKMGQYNSSRTYARKMIELDPNSGEAYMLIGTAYAASASSCGQDVCTKKAAYWAAVDKYVKAKSVDPSVAEEANKKIRSYSNHFPGTEDCFFLSITEGSSYTVGCWINEKTTARFSK